MKKQIYLGSIALEKNRWAAGRMPTYLVSDYLEQIKKDGFAGIELWENHYMKAGSAERKKLAGAEMAFLFNSYLSLKDGITDEIREIAAAIRDLSAKAVKFNYSLRDFDWDPGYTEEDYITQTDNLLRFAELVPGVKLLCECHANTLMEHPQRAGEVFARLDERFGAIVHLSDGREHLEACFDCYGDRICHVHTANAVEGIGFDYLESADRRMRDNYEFMVSRGFAGTFTVEFVKNAAEAEAYYIAAQKDLEYLTKLTEEESR